MKISRAQINAVVLHVLVPLPLLIGSGFLAYLFLFWKVVRSGLVKNMALIFGALALAWLAVRVSPVLERLTPQMRANAFNMTFSMLLIFASPFFRFRFVIAPSRYSDVLIVLFLTLSAVMVYGANMTAAILQVGSFSIVLYMFVTDTPLRRLLGASAAVLAGARILMLAIVFGWLLFHRRWLALTISVPLLLVAVALFTRADSWTDINGMLQDLRSSGTLLKGRVTYWLTLTSTEPTLFGNGAGNAARAIEERIGQFQLPHNEYLRIYSDYGVVTLLIMVAVLARNATSQAMHQRLSTLVLAFYMLTGNPLSFPTVIVSYILIMNATIAKKTSPVSTTQRGVAHIYPGAGTAHATGFHLIGQDPGKAQHDTKSPVF